MTEKTPNISALIVAVGEALWGSRWQSDMARHLWVSTDSVQDWKNGRKRPRNGVFDRLRELIVGRKEEHEHLLSRLDQIRYPEKEPKMTMLDGLLTASRQGIEFISRKSRGAKGEASFGAQVTADVLGELSSGPGSWFTLGALEAGSAAHF